MPQIIAGVVAVVGAVAGAISTAAVGATLALGGSLATASIVGEALYVAVPAVIEFGALAGASALLAPRPHLNVRGSPQSTKYDPQAPIPCVMGRYGVGGNVVYRTTSGGASKAAAGAAGNVFLTEFNILSGLGPIKSIDTLRFDDTVLVFSGQSCTGGYIESQYIQAYNPGYKLGNFGSYQNNNFVSHAWQNTQLGAIPSPGFQYPQEIQNGNDQLTEWTSAMGFSSFAASALTISYNVSVYAGGVPQKQWVIEGYSTYDPRLDSTYPGGAGAARWAGPGATSAAVLAARASWSYSQNPIIHALNYALGHYLPDPATGQGRLYAGIGAGPSGIDVDAFVRAANVADANGWTGCGQWTTGDGKWSVLTAMLQAGGAVAIDDRGRISCMVSTPRTSLGVIAAADLAGDITLDTGTSMRERINTVYPSYSSEPHRWQIVQADTPVRAATYIAEDGGVIRSKALTFEYVANVNQACQLAAYAICDGREIPAIVLVGKPHLRGYAVGDCLTLDVPEAGLGNLKVVVVKRSTSVATGLVTLTCRSETDAKHAYSLGISGVAPATPMISGYDPTIVPAPIPTAWSAAPATSTDASGAVTHVITINGSAVDNLYATTIVVSYAPVASVNGVDVDGSFRSQTYPASATTIDLQLAPGRWHVTLHYIIVSGAEAGADGVLDLGVIAVAADVAASAANLPGASTFGDAAASVTATLARIAAVEQTVSNIATQDNTNAIGALENSVAALDGLVSLTNPTANGVGAAVIAAQGSINYLSNNTVATTTYNGFVGQVGANTSRIGDLESGTTGPYGALATRTSTLETSIGTTSGQGSLFAQVAALASAQADSGYASASSVTALSAVVGDGKSGGLSGRLTTVETTVASLPSQYATVSYVQSLAASTTVGPNIVPDGDFAIAATSPNGTTWTVLTPTGSAFAQATDVGTRLITGTTATTNATGFDVRSRRFPLAATGTYTLQGCVTAYENPSNFAVRVVCYDASNNVTGVVASLPVGVNYGAPGPRLTATFTAPLNTTQGEVQVIGSIDADNYQLQMVKVEPGALATPWTDQATAGALAASVTTTAAAVTTLTGQAEAAYGVAVNAQGHVAGIKLVAANGPNPVSAFEVDASNFLVVTPSGATLSFSDGPNGGGQLAVQNLVVQTANIGAGQVGTNELGAGAVTEFSFWLNSYVGYLTNQGGGGGSPPATPTPPSTTAPPSGGGGGRVATP